MKKYRKPYRIKRKKSFFKSRFFWLIIFGSISFGAVFYFLFFSNYFQIKKIVFTGQEKVSSDNIKLAVENELEKKVLLFKTKSIFLTSPNKIQENILKKFPQIEKVEIRRKLPEVLSLTITEKKEVGIFCRDTACFLLDGEGVIFEFVQNESSLLKIQNTTLAKELKLGEKAIEKETLTAILWIASKLRENLKIILKEISIMSEEKIDVRTAEGWAIYFNLKENLNWQITKLAAVLEKRIPQGKRENLKYIDLRFEKVYIFPETYNQ